MPKVKGFTLIELLAVIAILAIVLLIAVPTVLNMIEKARTGAFRDNSLGILRASKDYVGYFNIGEEGYNLVFDENGKVQLDISKLDLQANNMTGYVEITKSESGYTYKVNAWDGTYRICSSSNVELEEVEKTNETCEGYVEPEIEKDFVKIVAVSMGQYTIALTQDGKVYVWGYNGYGQLGLGTSGDTMLMPTQVTTNIENKKVINIVVGTYHTIALTEDGKVYTWGHNSNGQLGYESSSICSGSVNCQLIPTQVTTNIGDKKIVDIAAGSYYTIAITEDGKVYTWGQNNYGQLGDNSKTDRLVPTAVTTNIGTQKIIAIAAGASHSLFLTEDGKVYAWGLNAYSQLGYVGSSTCGSSNFNCQLTPMQVTSNIGSLNIKKISVNGNHTIALTEDGKVYTWGYNSNGQLGDNSKTDRLAPTVITTNIGDKKIIDISSGYTHTIALTEDGKVYAWGLNASGQLGDNTQVDKLVPTAVTTNIGTQKIIAIAAGASHSLALTEDRKIYAWGRNDYGQLGLGTASGNVLEPIQVTINEED